MNMLYDINLSLISSCNPLFAVYSAPLKPIQGLTDEEGIIMADTTKKTTRAKKPAAAKASVPSAKAAAAEAKPAATPAAVKAAVKPAPVAAPVVAKPAPAPVVAPVAKPAPAPAPAATKVEQKTITKAERQRLVEQSAYFRAERHGFQGDSSQHWAAAEAEVDADLRKRNVRVI
jgi:hypothetical protein